MSVWRASIETATQIRIAQLLPAVDDAETISCGQDGVEWGVINGTLAC